MNSKQQPKLFTPVQIGDLHLDHRVVLPPLTRMLAAEGAVPTDLMVEYPTETGMLNRFTGTAERKASLAAGVPLGRVGEPDEIARAIVLLASDKASFVTGEVLTADGGKTAG